MHESSFIIIVGRTENCVKEYKVHRHSGTENGMSKTEGISFFLGHHPHHLLLTFWGRELLHHLLNLLKLIKQLIYILRGSSAPFRYSSPSTPAY